MMTHLFFLLLYVDDMLIATKCSAPDFNSLIFYIFI
jgi:hypothetical protein